MNIETPQTFRRGGRKSIVLPTGRLHIKNEVDTFIWSAEATVHMYHKQNYARAKMMQMGLILSHLIVLVQFIAYGLDVQIFGPQSLAVLIEICRCKRLLPEE
jgi:hypothetical protein